MLLIFILGTGNLTNIILNKIYISTSEAYESNLKFLTRDIGVKWVIKIFRRSIKKN